MGFTRRSRSETVEGRACFVDVETTGLNPAWDEVIELAAVLFRFRWETGEILGVAGEYAGLRQPGCHIPRSATRIHGLTDADVRGCRLDQSALAALFRQAEFLVAHNARFDQRFVVPLIPATSAMDWRCSMCGVAWVRYGFPSRSLQFLTRSHGIAVQTAHRGLDDVRSSLTLLSRSSPNGTPYFREVLQSRVLPCLEQQVHVSER